MRDEGIETSVLRLPSLHLKQGPPSSLTHVNKILFEQQEIVAF
jgi:hypothetical protein